MNCYLDLFPEDKEAVPGKGPLNAEYMIINLAPILGARGKNEPLGTSTWSVLSSIMPALNPNNVYATNLVKKPHPFGVKPNLDTIHEYYPKLIAEIKIVNPKKILILGALTAKVLCPGFKELRDDHGSLFTIPLGEGILAVPTFQPSSLGKDPSLFNLIKNDIKRFRELKKPIKPDYALVSDVRRLNEIIPPEANIYIDIETEGLDAFKHKITLVGLTWDYPGGITPPVYIIEKPSKSDLQSLYWILSEKRCHLTGHNFQFDLQFLTLYSEIRWDLKVHDTMVMAHNWGDKILSLKHLTSFYTMRPGPRALGGITDFAYLAEDVLSTRELYSLFRNKLETFWEGNYPFITELLEKIIPDMVAMRNRGVYINREKLKEVQVWQNGVLAEKLAILNQFIPEGRGPINWNSVQQTVALFLELGVVLTEKTDKGAYTLKEQVLLTLKNDYPIAQALLDYREAEKVRGFLEWYETHTTDDHPFVHPRLSVTGTETGRLSCKDPNIQQIPRVGPIKQFFVPRFPGGYYGLIDLSQAELRVAALLCKDPKFIEALLAEDVHRLIASKVFNKPEEEVTSAQRKKSKGVTFGLLYGGSPFGLAGRVGVPVHEVEQILEGFFGLFPILGEWLENTKKFGINNKYITSITGRRRDLTDLMVKEGPKSVARKATNTPIQGVASDIALALYQYVYSQIRHQKLQSRPIFLVHDSIAIEVHPDEVDQVGLIVQEAFVNLKNTPLGEMEYYSKLPIVGEFIVGKSWANVESTNEGYTPDENRYFSCSSFGVPTTFDKTADEEVDELLPEELPEELEDWFVQESSRT